MKFRPCIDLHEGKVKQIVGSSIGDELVENFVSDKGSEWFANLFKKDGFRDGHIIMLGEGNEKAALEALKSWPGGFQIGGGITLENAQIFLDAGASHVIVTSSIFRDGSLDMDMLRKISTLIGKSKLVIDISCAMHDDQESEYFIKTARWTKWTDFKINLQNIRLLSEFCDELLVHAISVEGKQSGIDISLLQILADCVEIPTTYAGGIHSLNDLILIKEFGKDKIDFTIGSALDIFGGKMCYDELVTLLREKEEG